jgi:UDP-N-acetylglucosamine diphosphorylase/glucosamine-1-phosphate N-acetyltransferase
VKPLLFLLDRPEDARRFLPFSVSRPIGELRYGALLLRERWSEATGIEVAGHIAAAHLADFVEPDAPPVASAPGHPGDPRLVFLSSFVPDPGWAPPASGDRSLRFTGPGGETVGVFLPPGTEWAGLEGSKQAAASPATGRLLAGVWQLVGDLPGVLAADLARTAAREGPVEIPRGTTVIGDPALVFTRGAAVEPQVVFDARNGPIVLSPRVEARAMTRLAGPLFVGPGTRLVGGQIGASAVGPRCVVHGEVTASLFLGYANKSHDGFLGHSVIGRWANLGAGTITSNLKNTYGPVRLTLDGVRHETGLINLGALVGDHVKTAIGTMLPTGCVIGAGANLFGSRRPPAEVPAFAWGVDEPGELLECERFLEIASRVMPRRDITVDEKTRRYLAAVWGAATRSKPCS